MRRYAAIFAVLLYTCSPAAAGELPVSSEPVMRGTIRGDFAYGSQCLSVPNAEFLPGVTLEMRPCRNSVDQIFEWNVINFEIKIHGLCVDALRAEASRPQPGDPVGLWYCQDVPHQRWFPMRSNPYLPTFNIVGEAGPDSNLCLATRHASTVAGTPLLLAPCGDGDDQQFRTQPWPSLDDEVAAVTPGQLRIVVVD